MQFIQIEGSLIWRPDEDNVFKLYKTFGDALKDGYSQGNEICEKLRDMCISVIRDRVANMTIMDILRNRNTIKVEIQKTLQDTLSGWGMKIDTVEISNVTIRSHELFKNMQTEFRESKNLIAE